MSRHPDADRIGQLARRYQNLAGELAGELTRCDRRSTTLAIVTAGAALAELVATDRMVWVVEALACGHTGAQIADSARIDRPDLGPALRRWAGERRSAGILTADQYARVLLLAGEVQP